MRMELKPGAVPVPPEVAGRPASVPGTTGIDVAHPSGRSQETGATVCHAALWRRTSGGATPTPGPDHTDAPTSAAASVPVVRIAWGS